MSEKKMSIKKVAEALEDGSRQWGTGRDRDTNLVAAGYDLDKIRLARREVRRKRLEDVADSE